MRISNRLVGWSLFFVLATSVSLHAQETSPKDIQKSCRNLVLGFYNHPGRRKSDSLDARLRRLLKEDEEAQDKDTSGYIVGLDFDAFLGGNDPPEGPFVVGRIIPKGNSYWAEVHNISSGKKSKQPVVVPEVMFKRGRWVLVNFHYPEYENGKLVGYGDLVGALKALREERRKKSQQEKKSQREKTSRLMG